MSELDHKVRRRSAGVSGQLVEDSQLLWQRAADAVAEAKGLCRQVQRHVPHDAAPAWARPLNRRGGLGLRRPPMNDDDSRLDGHGASPSGTVELSSPQDLPTARRLVGDIAAAAGLVSQRVAGLVLALSEVATNALVHGGGSATVLVHNRPEAVVVDVRDRGPGPSRVVVDRLPKPESLGGRGLWLAGQACDRVEVIGSVTGSVVRLIMDL